MIREFLILSPNNPLVETSEDLEDLVVKQEEPLAPLEQLARQVDHKALN